MGALPTTLAGALRSRGRRLGIDDPALLAPVALLTVLNLSADAFLAYAVTRGELAVVSVLASLAPVVTALLAHALTAERPSAPQLAGSARPTGVDVDPIPIAYFPQRPVGVSPCTLTYRFGHGRCGQSGCTGTRACATAECRAVTLHRGALGSRKSLGAQVREALRETVLAASAA